MGGGQRLTSACFLSGFSTLFETGVFTEPGGLHRGWTTSSTPTPECVWSPRHAIAIPS